jgi:hypothetical protein
MKSCSTNESDEMLTFKDFPKLILTKTFGYLDLAENKKNLCLVHRNFNKVLKQPYLLKKYINDLKHHLGALDLDSIFMDNPFNDKPLYLTSFKKSLNSIDWKNVVHLNLIHNLLRKNYWHLILIFLNFPDVCLPEEFYLFFLKNFAEKTRIESPVYHFNDFFGSCEPLKFKYTRDGHMYYNVFQREGKNCLYYIPEKCRTTTICEKAIEINIHNIKYVPKNIIDTVVNEEYVSKYYKEYLHLIHHFPVKFVTDEMYMHALKTDHKKYFEAIPDHRMTVEMAMFLINKSPKYINKIKPL